MSKPIAHGADRLRRIHTGESEEIKDVASAGVDAARLAATAVHGLHVRQQESVGNRLRKAGTTFETPWVLSSGVPISTMLTPPASAAVATVRPRSKVPTSTEI